MQRVVSSEVDGGRFALGTARPLEKQRELLLPAACRRSPRTHHRPRQHSPLGAAKASTNLQLSSLLDTSACCAIDRGGIPLIN